MKRLIRFALLLVAGLGIAPFLPLYVERTMLRSWHVDGSGDSVDWGWQITTLSDYWSDYSYFRHEQRPALWLGINVVLALTYALIVVVGIDWLFQRRRNLGKNP